MSGISILFRSNLNRFWAFYKCRWWFTWGYNTFLLLFFGYMFFIAQEAPNCWFLAYVWLLGNRVKVLSLDLSRISAAYWHCDIVSLQKYKVLFPKITYTLVRSLKLKTGNFWQWRRFEIQRLNLKLSLRTKSISTPTLAKHPFSLNLAARYHKSCCSPVLMVRFAVVIFTALKAFFYYGFRQ